MLCFIKNPFTNATSNIVKIQIERKEELTERIFFCESMMLKKITNFLILFSQFQRRFFLVLVSDEPYSV